MLVTCSDIKTKAETEEKITISSVNSIDRLILYDHIIYDILKSPSALGSVTPGMNKHFYSSGAFNLIQLVLYVLEQTGPADLFISTYSVAQDSIRTLLRKKNDGMIRNIRFLIDNRVRSISPKPFDFLVTSFPGAYRCCALHAKVALISNENFKISIVGSQNATHNPKLERGIIHTDSVIFDFDLNILEHEFYNGTT